MSRVAVITGVGRRESIGAAIVRALAEDGWDIGFTWWSPYDDRIHPGSRPAAAELEQVVRDTGRRVMSLAADLSDPEAPARVLSSVHSSLGPVTALICSHCESVDSDITSTSVESFDLHYAVNVRATWLLIRELGRQFPEGEAGRVVTLTSDHVVGNLPYGATKAAADRVTLAAAHELADRRITANAVNPGPIDTGWMDDHVRSRVLEGTPLGRHATPTDAANLVRFLCSDAGGWITGQLLLSNGGFTSSIP